MVVDRKALMKRMKEQKEQQQAKAKHIRFPMPDLSGPGGNAFALIGQGTALMKAAGLPETLQDEFRKEAMSDDYDKVLTTIQSWFTVAVTSTELIDIKPDFDITTLKSNDDGVLTWEDLDIESEVEGANEALAEYEASDEEVRRIAEIQDRINREVRAEFGLSDDEVVIVQIKKAKR